MNNLKISSSVILATLQVLKSHMWLVVATFDSTATEDYTITAESSIAQHQMPKMDKMVRRQDTLSQAQGKK